MKVGTQFEAWLILQIVAYVHCGKNLALNKPAWMSSVYYDTTVYSSVAKNSVDGHHCTNYFDGVCSSTDNNDTSPWIVVDLLGQYEVHNVTIYNRGDAYPERLHDFVIEVYRTNPSRCSTAAATVCKSYVGVFGSFENVVCERAVVGRFVRIWKPTVLDYLDILTVCEVEVYGMSPAHLHFGKNLALNKPAWMSSVYHETVLHSPVAENSVDGHHCTNYFDGVCSSTDINDQSPWIVVDLLGQYEVHNVTIYNRGDAYPERLHDFVIEVYRTNPSRCSTAAATVCKSYVGVFGSFENVVCERAVVGRFVRIWKPTVLNYLDILTVCEVEVYGMSPAHLHFGKNLALNKPAWMSSVYHETVLHSPVAENSVDGHHCTNYFDGVCSSTDINDQSPWIVVDLLGQYEVHNVTIYNRGDAYPERLHDFVIEVYRTNPSRCSTAAATVCKSYVGVFGSFENVVCERAVVGRFVRIWKPTVLDYLDILTVCEVEVYGMSPGPRCPSSSVPRVLGKRLISPGATAIPDQSKLSCVSLCLMSQACVSVNYNSGSKECELIPRPQPSDTVSSTQDSVFYGDDLC